MSFEKFSLKNARAANCCEKPKICNGARKRRWEFTHPRFPKTRIFGWTYRSA